MNNKNILVIAAHADDEVLGCGATVALKVLQGAEAHLVVLTDGVTGRSENYNDAKVSMKREIEKRRKEMKCAAKIIGFKSHEAFSFPDNRLDTVARADIANALRRVIEKIKPYTIFTHHPGDYNWDHTICFDSAMMAARRNSGDFSPNEIITFEVPSSTERSWQEPSRSFHPNLYVDVSDTIEKKKIALREYKSEYRKYPHPRSVEYLDCLARKRGGEVGIIYAEAFHIVRRIED